MRVLPCLALAFSTICVTACADPETARIKQTTKPTYDTTTGKLTELTYDRNKNGTIDTWTEMDGTRPVRSRSDLDEDGKLDRWEYYDDRGGLTKVGFSRKQDGKADAWAFAGPDGKVVRVEISAVGDESNLNRWEFYSDGRLTRAEEDTNADSRIDRWETYEGGALRTTSFDENGDGNPDRRMTYDHGRLVLIETRPNGSGGYGTSTRVTDKK